MNKFRNFLSMMVLAGLTTLAFAEQENKERIKKFYFKDSFCQGRMWSEQNSAYKISSDLINFDNEKLITLENYIQQKYNIKFTRYMPVDIAMRRSLDIPNDAAYAKMLEKFISRASAMGFQPRYSAIGDGMVDVVAVASNDINYVFQDNNILYARDNQVEQLFKYLEASEFFPALDSPQADQRKMRRMAVEKAVRDYSKIILRSGQQEISGYNFLRCGEIRVATLSNLTKYIHAMLNQESEVQFLKGLIEVNDMIEDKLWPAATVELQNGGVWGAFSRAFQPWVPIVGRTAGEHEHYVSSPNRMNSSQVMEVIREYELTLPRPLSP